MNENTKESKFLDAINRYAESQKAQIKQEIEDYKNNKIEQATEQGLQDAYELIRVEITRRKSAIVTETAKKELELRRTLYAERQQIADEVFSAAKEKLSAFTKTEDYSRFLERSAKEMKELFGENACTVSYAPFDEAKLPLLKSLFPNATFRADNHILLGGVKVFCAVNGMVADDTLDSRLLEQKQWFIENSGLEVV